MFGWNFNRENKKKKCLGLVLYNLKTIVTKSNDEEKKNIIQYNDFDENYGICCVGKYTKIARYI